MDTGNSTNSTIPKQCVGTVGSLPNLPYAMSCGTAAFGTVNDSHTESQFERCCGGNPIQLFGETAVGHTDCWWYCNSTSRSEESEISNCLKLASISSFGCEGSYSATPGAAPAVRIAGGWAPVVVLGLLLSAVYQAA